MSNCVHSIVNSTKTLLTYVALPFVSTSTSTSIALCSTSHFEVVAIAYVSIAFGFVHMDTTVLLEVSCLIN